MQKSHETMQRKYSKLFLMCMHKKSLEQHGIIHACSYLIPLHKTEQDGMLWNEEKGLKGCIYYVT